MDSQSLLNGMKDLFASLGAKTSDSSYAVPLVNSSTGEPKGFMSMANLASVLGAAIHSLRWAGTVTDLNIDETCYGYYSGQSDEDGLVLTLVFYSNDIYNKQYRLQIKTNDSGSTLKYRTMSAGGWRNWQLINHTETT